jgi:lysophospholipase L1-like esterase
MLTAIVAIRIVHGLNVLSHPHVDTVILMMGINDIGWPDSVLEPRVPAPSAEEIIDGYEQLIAYAHAHGMRIIGATLTPFGSPSRARRSRAFTAPIRKRSAWL